MLIHSYINYLEDNSILEIEITIEVIDGISISYNHILKKILNR